MKNDELRNCLDDALSGIGEDPWLLGKVVARAESGEDMKKKVSLGTALIVLAIVLLMSAAIAAVSNWNVLDFLREQEDREEAYITTTVEKEAETEGARLAVDSVVYDGEKLVFDLTLENKKPEVPMWCWVDKLTVNGEACEPGIVFMPNRRIDGEEGLLDQVSCGFEDQWLPGYEYPDGIAQCGEIVDLSLIHADGKEDAHVELRVRTYRPVRPFALLDVDSSFREELERMIDEGDYYVIPGTSVGGDELYPEGHFMPEEDPRACPDGWSIAVSGDPLTDQMGGMTEEILEISFDVKKTELVEGMVHLQTQESYEDENCTAVFEKADVSSLGLYLTLRVNPKNDLCRPAKTGWLTDGDGQKLKGSDYFPTLREISWSGEREGEMIWEYGWRFLREEDLPDTICVVFPLENGGEASFPVKVR